MKFCFGDIVVVDKDQIGVIVKCWIKNNESMQYEVYVCNYYEIREYNEKDIERYMVRHKELDEQELEWQHNATHPFVTQEEINDLKKKHPEIFNYLFQKDFRDE